MGSSEALPAASASWLFGFFRTGNTEFSRLVWTRIPLVVILSAGVVLERLDVALAGAHKVSEGEPSPVSGGFGDIATPARLSDPASALAIADGWWTLDQVAGPLIVAYGVFDFILMVVLTGWLNTLYTRRLPSGPAAKRGFPRMPPLPILGYFVADLVETGVLVCCWRHLSVPVAFGIAVASLLKWFFLGVSVLMIALRYRLTLPGMPEGADGSPPPPPLPVRRLTVRRAILALRGQLLVVVVLIGILLMLSGELGRQVDEVLVLAASRTGPAVLATVFAVLATAILAFGGFACLRAYLDSPPLPRAESIRSKLFDANVKQASSGAPQDPPQRKFQARLAVVFLATALALVLASLVVPPDSAAAIRTWAIPIGSIAVVFVPSWFVDVKRSRRLYVAEPDSDGAPVNASEVVSGREWIVLVLADVPMLALFLAIARAATTVASAGRVPCALIIWGLIVALVWFAVHVVLLWWAQEGQNWGDGDYVKRMLQISLPAGAVLLGCAFLPRLFGSWISFYQGVGTPAILMAFAAIVGLLLTGLTLLGDWVRPGGALEAFGIRRVPIFTGFLVWGLLASSIDSVGAYYLVRTGTQVPQRMPAQAAFERWKGAYAASGTDPVPLVFVAAAGGGIRAAYWTRLGMDCVFGTGCVDDTEAADHVAADHTGAVFLASGVSGGSLGLVSTRSEQQAGPDAASKHAVDTVLGEDFIAPSLASFLFADQANAFLRWPVQGANRADTLELAWEQADPELATPFGTDTVFPKLVLNSTSVEDGCRLEVSEIQFAAATSAETAPSPDQRSCGGDVSNLGAPKGPGALPTRDAFAHLCEGGAAQGISLSTAALMSARFPYVSPAGGLRGCRGSKRTFALDGGIYDNSGGTAVLEAWQAISAAVSTHNATAGAVCIVPKLVVFDSARAVGLLPEVDNRPPQASAPLVAALGGFGRRSSTPLARAAQAIQAGADAATESCSHREGAGDAKNPQDAKDAQNAVAVIAPNEQPGPSLPLGWTLSAETRSQMRCQLGGKALVANGPIEDWPCEPGRTTDELKDVRKVRSWFG